MRNRRSRSFTRPEIDLACQLFSGLLAGRDVRGFSSHAAFLRLSRRFFDMQTDILTDERAEAQYKSRTGNPWGWAAP